MNNLTILRPKEEESVEINQLFKAVILDTFNKNNFSHLTDLIAEEIEDKKKYLKEGFETKGKKHFFLIGKIDEKIVAAIEYTPASNLLNSCTDNKYRELMEVGTVYVHPEYQGQKIGMLMFTAILKELKKIGEKEFCLDSGYPSAQKIWCKKFGSPAHLLKDYWGKGADHMVWKLDIEEGLEMLKIL